MDYVDDDAEVVQNLALPEPEHVDDIQEDVEVEDDPGVGTQEDNNPGVVSQADGDSYLERSPQDEADFVEAECRNAENNNEESRRARAKVDNENVGLGEKDDVQSAYYDCEDPLSYQSEKEEVETSFEHITNAATSRFKYPSYNPNLESVDLEVGILYDDEKQFKKTMINYAVDFNGDDGYEIKKGRQQFKVKLAGRSCSCRAWDLSGKYGRASKTSSTDWYKLCLLEGENQDLSSGSRSECVKAVTHGWTHPKRIQEDKSNILASVEQWSTEEINDSDNNNKALNIITGSLDESQFGLIAGCSSAKDAWEILEKLYEGDSSVKQTKMQQVLTRFEELRMKDEETIVEFNARVQELKNEAAVLGEPFSSDKLVRKILRSLPVRFRMKVTAIQESVGWETKSVAELMSNLRTYEMDILSQDSNTKRGKNVAFLAEKCDSEEECKELDDESVAMITRNFTKILKQINRRNRGGKNQQNRPNSTAPSSSNSSRTVGKLSNPNQQKNFGQINQFGQNQNLTRQNQWQQGEVKNKNKGIQCRECEGFGHIQVECATYLKRKKSMKATTWSDEDCYEEAQDEDEEISGNFVAFTAVVAESHSDLDNCSDHEDVDKIPYEELEQSYIKLYKKWDILLKTHTTTNSKNEFLEKNIESLKKQVVDTNAELAESNSKVMKLSAELEAYKKQIQMMNTTSTLNQILDSGRAPNIRNGTSTWTNVETYQKILRKYNSTCHYCCKKGHIRPECYRFYSDQRTDKFQKKWITPVSRQVWGKWYFDSGCSRHMTGSKEFLKNVIPYTGQVTFGDGIKGDIMGIGILNVAGLPSLSKVLLVQGLKANLSSINQLCDQKLNVGTTTDNTDLWHQRLGHMNYQDMNHLISHECVRGVPKFKVKETGVCGPCQLGKQTRTPHKHFNHIGTSSCLDLLHMDLIGPTQFEKLCLKLQKEKGLHIGKIVRIRSDHGRKFKNQYFSNFCSKNGISHEFLAPKTPQQNGVVERKNRTIQEMARVLISSKDLPQFFWVEAVHTACHIINRVYLRLGMSHTPYELWRGRKPNLKYFRIFCSRYYILNDREKVGKFEPKSDEGIFLGYSPNSRAYRVYNKRIKTVQESINVIVDDQPQTVGEYLLAADLEQYQRKSDDEKGIKKSE
ncbi:uncharacterized protein LOC115996034 [Ipomoea triloba]|uniref:uncharacterized protein LOC115996034 n=1 Tax=Ipomoea triloba TaxID=35885 RepID=UPI00125D3747|nr:uncharacterized protein LOC115996034 [Ipomoea triloba]